MGKDKTVGEKPIIVSFERIAPGILIPVGQEKSYWKDKLAEEKFDMSVLWK